MQGQPHRKVDLAMVDGAHGAVADLLGPSGGPAAAEVVGGRGACLASRAHLV